MPFDIAEFRARGLPEGGARPSLFEVWLDPPGSSNNSERMRFQCMASQIPASTLGTIDVPYFGRKVKEAGDRVFADWNINIINDESFPLRAIMEKWSNDINTMQSNLRIGPTVNDYKSKDGFVTQYGKQGIVLRRYRIIGVWPNNVEAINLDWDRTNAIETFAVTLSYDYWILDDQGQSPDIVDEDATN